MIYVKCRYCGEQLQVAKYHWCDEMKAHDQPEKRVSLEQYPKDFASLSEASTKADWMIPSPVTDDSSFSSDTN